ncbi:MAG: glycoside hydrolase family 3 N-terminal domain-containing protein [Caulobacteraceae bacterium]
MSVLAAISRRAMPALLAAALLAGAAARAQDGAAVAEATRLVGQMTLDEKLAFLDGDAPPAGTGTGVNACVGHLPGLPRLGIPPLCFGDGPAGVSNGATKVTQFPAPEAAAASWDVALMREFGRAMAEEQSGKGRNVVLGPTLNILRTPRWGRAGESFGEDPYLTAQLGVAEILGLQERGVIAEAKHFAANNQETDRLGDGPDFHAVDARVGERALQEIYLPAFKARCRTARSARPCAPTTRSTACTPARMRRCWRSCAAGASPASSPRTGTSPIAAPWPRRKPGWTCPCPAARARSAFPTSTARR